MILRLSKMQNIRQNTHLSCIVLILVLLLQLGHSSYTAFSSVPPLLQYTPFQVSWRNSAYCVFFKFSRIAPIPMAVFMPTPAYVPNRSKRCTKFTSCCGPEILKTNVPRKAGIVTPSTGNPILRRLYRMTEIKRCKSSSRFSSEISVCVCTALYFCSKLLKIC